MELFSGTKSLGVTPEQIFQNWNTRVPEFGTVLFENVEKTHQQPCRIATNFWIVSRTDVWLGSN